MSRQCTKAEVSFPMFSSKLPNEKPISMDDYTPQTLCLLAILFITLLLLVSLIHVHMFSLHDVVQHFDHILHHLTSAAVKEHVPPTAQHGGKSNVV